MSITGCLLETLGADGYGLFIPGIHGLVQETVSFVKGQDGECLELTSRALSTRRSRFFLCVGMQSHKTEMDQLRLHSFQWHSVLIKQAGGWS